MNIGGIIGGFLFGLAIAEFYNFKAWKMYFKGKGDRYGSRR